MKPQRLLYLSACQMTACHWRGGALVCEATFPSTQTGWRQFAYYLAQNPGSIFSLLVNVAEEGFRIETIPYLRGADRQTVIERKLAQTFSNTPLCAALSLGHEKDRRKNENLLLAAFTNPAFFQPWLDAIRAADAMLSGIFSLPLLASSLLRKLSVSPEPCLLLSVQDQSIRQSFFDKGGLRFSRLTPLQHNSIDSIAQAFAAESIKLQQYLVGQRLISRGQTLTAHVLAHPDAFKILRNSCIDTPVVRFNILDITECARRIGLKTKPRDTCAESLFLHLLATHRTGIQFAGEDLRHGFRIARSRSLLQGAGALALTVCLLLSANTLFDARQISLDTEVMRVEAASARRGYDDIVKTFPSIPVDNETLKSVIGRYLAEERRSTTPGAFYREISRALQTESSIEIDRLDWKISDADTDTTDSSGWSGDVRPVSEDSESIVVQGTLRLDARITSRQLLGVFGHFVDALRSSANLRVEVLQQPLDIASGASLRGSDVESEGEKPREFALRVTRRIEP
ncbi:hypothetical protein AGMMS50256_26890 [Betaproteobacteria bacterium]|nr:hypothetical protein AGMMS50256_26890 [Betaproteobacteria bacterium]